MLKRDVIENLESCFHRAHDQEQLFVMLARDPAAPVAIRAWITERIRLGKNAPGDEQIREAYECATLMELQCNEIGSLRGQQQLPWDEGGVAPMMLSISRFASLFDQVPLRETMSWLDFTALLSEPRRSPCVQAVCARASCPYKRGASWSPGLYASLYARAVRRPQSVEAITLLVFDVERVTDEQLYEIRGRISSQRYLIHSTHSDRPNSRCLRFVFPLSRPVLPDAWALFWRAARQCLVPGADSACADATRVYFLPSCPRDASYFFQVNEGAPLDVDTVLAIASPPQIVIPSTPCAEGESAP